MKPLDKLKEEYIELLRIRKYTGSQIMYSAENYYKGMRDLAVSCSLLSLSEIEEMEKSFN